MQKKSALVGQRPGVKVSKMLSQFKSYAQPKKNPVLSQRPSVFSSPDDDDEEEETDYSRFLEMKGNSRPVSYKSDCGPLRALDSSMVALRTPVEQLPCVWHIVICAF